MNRNAARNRRATLRRHRINQASGWFGPASPAVGARGPGNARRRPCARMCERRGQMWHVRRWRAISAPGPRGLPAGTGAERGGAEASVRARASAPARSPGGSSATRGRATAAVAKGASAHPRPARQRQPARVHQGREAGGPPGGHGVPRGRPEGPRGGQGRPKGPQGPKSDKNRLISGGRGWRRVV